MIGILYVIIFIFTVILEVLIVKKSKGKRWFRIIIYLLLSAISTRKVGAMHGFVFVPVSVLLYVYLYKINLAFTIIFSIEH